MDRDFSERRSARLRITRFAPEHAAAFAAYRDRAEVARYQSWQTFTLADAEAFIAGMAGQHPDTPGEWFQFAVLDSDGRLVGDVALHVDADDARCAEIGFTLAPAFAGRGYASEAVRTVLRYAFFERSKHRIRAVTDARNARSIALLERLAFRREAHFRQNIWFKGAWGDEYVYALLHSDEGAQDLR